MKKWIIAILVLAIFIVSVFAGFIVRSFVNFSKGEKEKNSVVLAEEKGLDLVDTDAKEETVSPNAEVVLTQVYKRCGHTRVKKEIVPREIVNLNREGVEQYYDGWNIDEFSSNLIKLSRNDLGICDEHYILRESDGFISINCKNNSGEYIFKGLTDISVQYLSEDDLKKLEQGIEVVGRENLNRFLEDYE